MGKKDPRVDAYIDKANDFAIEWITEARTAETRGRRVKTAIEWMSEGKARNWKYMRA